MCKALVLLLPAIGSATTLQPIPEDTLRKIRVFAERGELALIESNKNASVRQLTVVAVVQAPINVTWKALSTTEDYPKFVPNVVLSRTRKQTGNVRWVDWELEVPLFNLKGTNKYTFSPPNTMLVETSSGDLKTGHWRWELVALGDKQTLLVEYAYSDVRELNFVMRKLIARSRYVEHGTLLTSATIFMKATKARAEKMAGTSQAERPDARGQRSIRLQSIREFATAEDIEALEPLLDRGVVTLTQSLPDGRLHQAVLFQRVYVPTQRLYALASHPERWDDFMVGIEEAYAIEDKPEAVLYRMKVKAPFVSMNFRAKTTRGPDWLRTTTVDGDLKNAQFGWEFFPRGSDQTLAVYYANADMRRNSWVVRQLVDREPFFEHGLNVSASLLTVTLVRGEAEGWLRRKKR